METILNLGKRYAATKFSEVQSSLCKANRIACAIYTICAIYIVFMVSNGNQANAIR